MNLNQVTIPVSDVARSINFYQKLGLKLIVAESHYARFECPGGDSTFSVYQTDETKTGSGPWIYFEVQDVDNYVQGLVATGIKFEELPNDKTWLWRESTLKDPDNNQLIIYFAGKNRKYPPWRMT
jgi:catechol 2,3-dioxygenase-like lactoylglutathione lyase family enzyme